MNHRSLAAADFLSAVAACETFSFLAETIPVPQADRTPLHRAAFDRLVRTSWEVRDLLAADPTPIRFGRREVFLNDKGRPAYRTVPAKEVAPCSA